MSLSLYQIDQQIMALVDPETGEITDVEALTALDMERTEKLENIACFIKNLAAESAAFAEEIKNLQARKKTVDNTAERLKSVLAGALNEEKFQTTRCSVSFRHTKSVEITDPLALIGWCEENGHDDFVVYDDPKISKTEIKKLLQAGEAVPGAEIVTNVSMGVK